MNAGDAGVLVRNAGSGQDLFLKFLLIARRLRRALVRTDTDKLFPAFGFGGKLGPNQPANHCFPVNFMEDRPELEGMDGVLQVREAM